MLSDPDRSQRREERHVLVRADPRGCRSGFRRLSPRLRVMKLMIECGAAAVHFEDQLASEKKCGHLGGKVLVPTSQFVRTLSAARLAADVMGVPTLIVARTDANSATLLTSDVDPRDHEFLTGERTARGFRIRAAWMRHRAWTRLRALRRSRLVETSSPISPRPGVSPKGFMPNIPGKMLAYNCSPSFNWEKKFRRATSPSFSRSSRRWATSSSSSRGRIPCAESRCSSWRASTATGMTRLLADPGAEFSSEEHGFPATNHQTKSAPATSTK